MRSWLNNLIGLLKNLKGIYFDRHWSHVFVLSWVTHIYKGSISVLDSGPWSPWLITRRNMHQEGTREEKQLQPWVKCLPHLQWGLQVSQRPPHPLREFPNWRLWQLTIVISYQSWQQLYPLSSVEHSKMPWHFCQNLWVVVARKWTS